MLGLSFSSKLDQGFYIASIAKTTSKKVGKLIRCIKFITPDIALCFRKSTVEPCLKYYCYVWAGAPGYLYKLEFTKTCGYLGLLVLHLRPVLNHWLIVESCKAKV